MCKEMEKQFEPTFKNLIEWADNSLPRFNRVLALRRRHLSSQLQQGTFENPFTCDEEGWLHSSREAFFTSMDFEMVYHLPS